MSEPDLEARVAALEARIGELSQQTRAAREDAAAARHLAAADDRDNAELHDELRDFRQATTSSFNAHREDLADLRQEMGGLRREMGDLRQEMGDGFTEVRGKLDGTAAGLEQISGLLHTLIGTQGRSETDEK